MKTETEIREELERCVYDHAAMNNEAKEQQALPVSERDPAFDAGNTIHSMRATAIRINALRWALNERITLGTASL